MIGRLPRINIPKWRRKSPSYERVANPDSMDDAGLPSMALNTGFTEDMMVYLDACYAVRSKKLVNMHLT